MKSDKVNHTEHNFNHNYSYYYSNTSTTFKFLFYSRVHSRWFCRIPHVTNRPPAKSSTWWPWTRSASVMLRPGATLSGTVSTHTHTRAQQLLLALLIYSTVSGAFVVRSIKIDNLVGPVKGLVGFVLLYRQLGPAVLAGMAVPIIYVPVIAHFMKLLIVYNVRTQKRSLRFFRRSISSCCCVLQVR